MESDHGLTEQRSLHRMRCEPVEDRHTVSLLEAGLSGLKRIGKMFPRPGDVVPSKGQDRRAGGTRGIGLQRLAEWRQREATFCILRKETEHRERSQDAVKGGSMCLCPFRQYIRGLRSLREMISKAQFRRGVNEP